MPRNCLNFEATVVTKGRFHIATSRSVFGGTHHGAQFCRGWTDDAPVDVPFLLAAPPSLAPVVNNWLHCSTTSVPISILDREFEIYVEALYPGI